MCLFFYGLVISQIVNKASSKHKSVVAAVNRLAEAARQSFQPHWLDGVRNMFGVLAGGRFSCYRTFFVPSFVDTVRILATISKMP